MSLLPGTRIGPYQVVGPLGAGGMGEVYRARDTRLGRDVALKILPDVFAADPDRLMRFEREARTLASLNHPHIAQIHGLEETNGARALVMELVEGEDLSARIGRGPIPLDEALPIARKIAEALEAAHELGIIHRDLKPANIKVRDDGAVKVLDFGLAKALDPADSPGHSELANSPTITSPALTMRGVVLGTAAYMAPEQAKGKPVDKRADIWAFGCVLYEMLTGRRAFGGDDTTDTIVAVVSKEPDWTQLPAGVPASVVRLLRRCLVKDRHNRLPDIAAARLDIDDSSPASPDAPRPVPNVPPRFRLGWVAAGAAGLLLGALGARALYPRNAAATGPAAATRSYIGESTRTGVGHDVAISRDGLRVVFVGAADGLFLRSVDRLEAIALAGTAGARSPFFSPDGRWIGYFDRDNALTRMPADGGRPEIVTRLSATQRGATWLDDDTIVFATNDPSTGLLRVAASGGDATTLTTPDGSTEGDHVWPAAVAGRAAVIYTVAPSRGTGAPVVSLFDIETGRHQMLVRGANDARYVSPGFLVHSAPGSTTSAPLYVRAFDLARPDAAGAPVQVVDSVVAGANLNISYDVAPDGTLVYLEALAIVSGRGATTLAWMDQAGVETPVGAPPRAYLYPRVSPDGRRIALDVRDQESDIWIWDIAGATLTRLTTDRSPDRFPAWLPDSRTVVYTSERDDVPSIYRQSVMGTGEPERLTQGPNSHAMNSVVSDGSAIIVRESAPQYDLVRVVLPGGGPGQPLVKTPFLEQNGEVSPDRRWFAYESNESGPFHVYVRPYPDVDSGRWQISQEGGTEPSWSRDGKALFFRSNRHALMRVDLTPGAEWTASPPRRLFDLSASPPPIGGAARSYDQAPDGRFIVIRGTGFVAPGLVLVTNWIRELRAQATAAGEESK